MKALMQCWDKTCKRLQSYGWLPALITRLSVGWVFFEAGWGKLHNLPMVIGYFEKLGIPAPALQAPFVAGVEFVGGFLILIGLATRLAAIPLSITMVVAVMTAKRAEIASVSDLFGFSEFLYWVLFVWLIYFGAGCISVDYLLKRKCRDKAGCA